MIRCWRSTSPPSAQISPAHREELVKAQNAARVLEAEPGGRRVGVR